MIRTIFFCNKNNASKQVDCCCCSVYFCYFISGWFPLQEVFGWWLCSGSVGKWGRVEPGVKVGVCVQILLFGWHTSSGGGVVEAARARVRCAWAKFKELLLFWLCVVHLIGSKEGSIVLVSRVSWYMELKRGQWRLMTWEVWKGQSVWWWDGCVGCPWKTENAVRIYATFLY